MEQDQLLSRRTSEYKKVRFATQGTDYFFILVLIAFFGTLLAWGGAFAYTRSLLSNASNSKVQIGVITQELRQDFGDTKLVLLSDKIAAAKVLLANHVLTSKVFLFLQEKTLPKVSFANFSFASETRQIDMIATAANYQVLADQIAIFEALPQVQRVEFGGLSLSDANAVSFRLTIVLNNSMLKLSTDQNQSQ